MGNYLGFAEKVPSLRQGIGNSFSYLLSPDFLIYQTQNAQFLRYTLQKSCIFFPPDQPQTFDLRVLWVYSASPI